MSEARELLHQVVRFAAVGIFNTIVGLGIIFALMALLGVHALLANIAGYTVGICVSYALNRRWTFGVKHSSWATRSRFLMVIGVAYIVQFGLLSLLLTVAVNPYIAQLLAMGTYALVGFVGSRFLVFRTPSRRCLRQAE